ncbi:ribosomal prt L39 [Enterospora canceri]|uniref:Ribosomal prt L39 n=1 Tax=Enterospora canceri TaxID=1081671 RepID=A0A1Y1S8X0_9MICR|nr:ribosomal prt L39 [Enterospora canceri]
MGSRKSMLVKKRLTRAFVRNSTMPTWKRLLPENRYKQARNKARRNWRSTKLKIH